MSDKIYLGSRLSDLDIGEPSLPVSKVILNVDSQVSYVSGDDTGLTIEQSCPWATQAMADNVLSKLKGFIYNPYTGADALLDPAAELGDALTVGGTYGILAQMGRNLDRQGSATVGAPGTDEIEDEYPYKSKQRKETDRALAKAYSRISKTAEEIRLEVQNEVDGLSSSITVRLDSITATVQGQNGKISSLEQTVDSIRTTVSGYDSAISEIEQKVDSITLSVSNKSASSVITLSIDGVEVSSQTIKFTGDVVFASDLEDGTTTVSGDCITTGTLDADKIYLNGKFRIYGIDSADDSEVYAGQLGFYEGEDSSGETTHGIMMRRGKSCVIVTDGGTRLEAESDTASSVTLTGNINLETDGILWLTGTSIRSSTSISNVSDRRKKNTIQYDVEKYLPIFNALSPASFYYNEHDCGKRHLGFIAQDVEEAMTSAGITHSEFAPLDIREDGFYGLRYEEFIPLLVAKVQQLDTKIKELTA